MVAALLALALAAQAGDPCLATDERGRTFALCFDPGNRIELSAGGAVGDREPQLGGALDLRAAVRWRRDVRSRTGALEWMLDQTFGEARALFAAGDAEPIAASALAWRGTFLRHRGSPFVLVPGPRPLRLPFPFDVGLRVEVGGASWDAARRHDVTLSPIRSALLLDVAGHGVLRRLAFGPEVSWGVRVLEHAQTVHDIVPFTAGVLDVRAESRDGLHALSLTFRGGARRRGRARLRVELRPPRRARALTSRCMGVGAAHLVASAGPATGLPRPRREPGERVGERGRAPPAGGK